MTEDFKSVSFLAISLEKEPIYNSVEEPPETWVKVLPVAAGGKLF